MGDQRACFFMDQSEAEKPVERTILEKTCLSRKGVYRALLPINKCAGKNMAISLGHRSLNNAIGWWREMCVLLLFLVA